MDKVQITLRNKTAGDNNQVEVRANGKFYFDFTRKDSNPTDAEIREAARVAKTTRSARLRRTANKVIAQVVPGWDA